MRRAGSHRRDQWGSNATEQRQAVLFALLYSSARATQNLCLEWRHGGPAVKSLFAIANAKANLAIEAVREHGRADA